MLQVYIEVRNELNQTVPFLPVGFEVVIMGAGHCATYEPMTNASGIATIINPINPNVAAKYIDIATASYGGTTLIDSTMITVQLGG